MREIKFRGKRFDNGKWVYGDLLYLNTKPHVFTGSEAFEQDEFITSLHSCEMCEVIPETVSQYTRLTDKNGQEIYEGDILKFADKGNTFTAAVEWNYENGVWCITFEYRVYVDGKPLGEWLYEYDIEVIGNIHDNPELLEGGEI